MLTFGLANSCALRFRQFDPKPAPLLSTSDFTPSSRSRNAEYFGIGSCTDT
ncbi:MAG: hypothetical protein JWQ71_3089 [Pedosphaera sp.]|nr:hypothetical protein [Pedosphaera sp.]